MGADPAGAYQPASTRAKSASSPIRSNQYQPPSAKYVNGSSKREVVDPVTAAPSTFWITPRAFER